MAGSDKDRGKSRRLGVEDRGWSNTRRVLGGWMIERLVTLCDLHYAQGDEEHGFLGLSSKPRSMVSPCLTFKTGGYGSCGLASKPLARVFRFGPQNQLLVVW
jgi:hypothetical protein